MWGLQLGFLIHSTLESDDNWTEAPLFPQKYLLPKKVMSEKAGLFRHIKVLFSTFIWQTHVQRYVGKNVFPKPLR